MKTKIVSVPRGFVKTIPPEQIIKRYYELKASGMSEEQILIALKEEIPELHK